MWLSSPRRVRGFGIALLAAAICCLSLGCACAPALAGGSDDATESPLDAMVRFLQKAQEPDGAFTAIRTRARAALGLAAAGVNPQDQAAPGGRSALSYLESQATSLQVTTDFERELLVVDAAGSSPTDFGGVNLERRIEERQLPDGSFVHLAGESGAGVNDTTFAILALGPIAAQHEHVLKAAEWLEAAHDDDGGWPSTCPHSSCAGWPSSVDVTAAAVEALVAAGRGGGPVVASALAFLARTQLIDGGFPQILGEEPANVASTAWTVQAIWAAGQEPAQWVRASGAADPLQYMASLQNSDGGVSLSGAGEASSVWMTAYTLPAFAHRPLPMAQVALSGPPTAPPAAEPAGAPQSGGSATAGPGVLAGGGGAGAQLFTPTQPGGRAHRDESHRTRSRAAATAHTAAAGLVLSPAAASGAGAGGADPAGHGGAATAATSAKPESGAGTGRQVTGTLLGSATAALSSQAVEGLRSAGDPHI